MKKSVISFLVSLFVCYFIPILQSFAQVQPSSKFYQLGVCISLKGHPAWSRLYSEMMNMMNSNDVSSFSFRSFLTASSFGRLDYEFVLPNYLPSGIYIAKLDVVSFKIVSNR